MTKNSLVPDEVKLSGSYNYHVWKYYVMCAVKKEQLWNTLEPSRDSKKSQDPNHEEKMEAVLNILVFSICPDLMGNLTSFHDLKNLWDFLKETYEINTDSRKYHLKNKLSLVTMNEEIGFKPYVNKFRNILSQLSSIGDNCRR
uniref:Retrotransposon Copia-like N-terminal domain-containing protein n=1 Tax=Physcomitrium patens TaxID=3218 RepID=A0A2K1ILW2_PHYPA|nr:hypothetical protein PHYPA_026574 [Physcomitrium patens]